MRGRHDDPAILQMRRHQRGELPLRGGVQPRRRLVEQPDRAVADQHPGDRRAPPLSGREVAERQVADVAQPHHLQRLGDLEVRLAEEVAPEGEVLRDAQRRLHRVLVTEVMRRAAGRRPFLPTPFQPHAPGGRRQQPGDDSQERRLARTVGPGDRQRLALSQREGDALEDRLAAALPRQVLGDQPHCVSHQSRPPRRRTFALAALEVSYEIRYGTGNRASGRHVSTHCAEPSAPAAFTGGTRGTDSGNDRTRTFARVSMPTGVPFLLGTER